MNSKRRRRQHVGIYGLLVIVVFFAAMWQLQLLATDGVEGSSNVEVESITSPTSPTGNSQSQGEVVFPPSLSETEEPIIPPTHPFVNVPIISDNSLAAAPNPRTYQARLPTHNFEVYAVERGETPNQIADKHNISAETLLGGNRWLSQESNALQSGAELLILPIDGLLHTVQPGETLEDIADLYDVAVADIISVESNNLEYPFFRMVPDTELLIPGATVGKFYWTAPKSVAGVGADGNWAVVGTGSHVWPVNGRCITQYFWAGHAGLDVSMSEGAPVVASDRGTVTYASWAADSYFDYGNLIVINHGNGYETLYAHLSGIGVYPGQVVQQGEYIGGTGNTGRSSGPHLHFEIRLNDFRDDPLFYLSGPTQSCS